MAGQLKVTRVANATALAATTPFQFMADFHKPVSVHAVWTVTTVSATVKLQLSNDGATWDDFATATAITATGNVAWYLDAKDALYVRVLYTHTSGASDTFKAYVANVPR